jgi:two-component system CheB/CheR fusion protein
VAGRVVPAFADVFLTDLLVGQTLEQVAMACVDAPATDRLRKRRPPDLSGDHPIAGVIRTGDAVLVPEVPAAWREHWIGSPEEQDLWGGMPLTSVVIVPITSHRQTHGALTFGLARSGRRYDPTDLAALRDIGVRTALALDTARVFRDLEAEQHHRDEFLAMLAHELRNPLSAVTTGLAVLEQVDPVSRARLLAILGRQSRHLARLLNDLLDVSGVRFGRLVLDRQRLDLRDLARDALEVVRTARTAVGPAIELRTDAVPVTVVGDADRLQQTIANLLDNAVKYTPTDGSIAVSVRVEEGDAVVRVRDTGVGIAPEFLPRIFDVFSRAGSSGGQSRPGLGLGLSVVRELVVKHGGSVSATSPGVGRGSEFAVRLPLDSSEDAPHPEEARSAPVERSILIVEDHPDACDGLCIALSLKGHHVRAARTGRDAIEETRVQPPEIALVDIGLPDIDGYEVGRIIRNQPGGDGVYLVALTGLSAPADVDNALRAGFDSYIVKPVDPEKLVEVIAHAHR